ncbi:MAG TPA: molybdopterin-dependent oxidoreductase [Burkholderiales bacterium]
MIAAERVLKSTCRMCHGGCSTLLHVKDDRIVRIEGDPEGPLNHGRLCPMGHASLELVRSPKRLTHPQIRTGARGEGKWRRASWDEAYDYLCEKIRAIWDRYGKEGIAIGTGTGRHHLHWVPRFANMMGTPNAGNPGMAQCLFPRVNTMNLTYGQFAWCDYRGSRMPGSLLFWGHNPLTSSPDGEVGFQVLDALKANPKIIVVDPRRTWLAKQAHVFLQLRPGTDDALALAMLNCIIADGSYDKAFVEKWTHGFDQLAERVKPFTPEWAQPITWVPAEKIRAAARLWMESQPGALEWGCAIEHTPNTIQTVRAISMLPALAGSIDIPGGWVFGMRGVAPFPFLPEVLPEEQRRKRLGADAYKVLAGAGSRVPSAHMPSVFKSMRTGEPYWTKGFLVFGNNALSTYADSRLVRESLMKLDLLMVADLFMTPTCELADVVLPVAAWPELDQVVAMPYHGEDVISVQQRGEQVGECKQDEMIMTELARRLRLPHCDDDPYDIFNALVKPTGLTYNELAESGPVKVPMKYRKYEEKGFATPTGKIELYSTAFEKLGYDPLPYYEEPPESPLSRPDLLKDFPYVLTTGARIPVFYHSEYRQLPKLRRGDKEPRVEIHPDTAKAHGIGDGDWVAISSPRGSIRQRAVLSADIHPQVINCEHGWWFPERDDPEHGAFESNANVLTNQSPPYDPAMGTYQLRGMLCRVEKEKA